jgi:hypothetical protein
LRNSFNRYLFSVYIYVHSIYTILALLHLFPTTSLPPLVSIPLPKWDLLWDRVLMCSPGWPWPTWQTWDSPASVSSWWDYRHGPQHLMYFQFYKILSHHLLRWLTGTSPLTY